MQLFITVTHKNLHVSSDNIEDIIRSILDTKVHVLQHCVTRLYSVDSY
jgi:hypothetical protein